MCVGISCYAFRMCLGGNFEASWGQFWGLWASFGGLLGSSWGLWGVLGASWGPMGASWGTLGAPWGSWKRKAIFAFKLLVALLALLGHLGARRRSHVCLSTCGYLSCCCATPAALRWCSSGCLGAPGVAGAHWAPPPASGSRARPNKVVPEWKGEGARHDNNITYLS